jgi:hypothetical protein
MHLSKYFKYSGSPQITDTLKPGYGHWIKSDKAGSLILNAASTANVPASNSAEVPPATPSLFTAPVLDLPVNGAVDQSLSPTLSWEEVTEATGYHLQVSTDSAFASLICNDSTLTNLERQVGSLAIGTTYYWRVRAKDDFEYGPWSSKRHFTTTPVASPVLTCSDCALGHHPAMTWTNTAGTNGAYRVYRLQCPQTGCTGDEMWRGMTGWMSGTSYTDYAVTVSGKDPDGSVYYYHVQAKNQAGQLSDYSNTIHVNSEDGWITKTIAQETGEEQQSKPTEFALYQNYPNGFNPTTQIRYAIPTPVHVMLRVYDMLGRVVATLVEGEQTAGYKSVEFNAANISSGVYLYRITAGDFTAVKKMLIVK